MIKLGRTVLHTPEEAPIPAYIDFKKLAEQIDITDVAALLHIKYAKNRGSCPACNSTDERALQLFPETNSYRCYSAQESGDCISLYAHIKGVGMYAAAKALQEQFQTTAVAGEHTPPQRSESRTAKAQPAPNQREFDPESYASKLVYNDQVAALGISEEDATRLSIGYASSGLHRGRVVFPVRNTDGSVAGFVSATDLKLPNRWQQGKIVPFAKRA